MMLPAGEKERKLHRRHRLVAATTAALMFAVLSSRSEAKGPKPDGDNWHRPTSPTVAVGDTGPDDPASAWYAIDGATFADGTVAKALGTDRYGGFWWEGTGASSVIVIGVKGLTTSDEALVKTLTNAADRVRFRNVRHSYAELGALSDGVSRYLAGQRLTSDVGLGRDPTPGSDTPFRLTIKVESATATQRAWLTQAVPADVLGTLSVGTDAVSWQRSTNRRDPFQPFWAGEAMYLIAQPNFASIGCTSGFLMVGPYGYFASTAGHCGIRPQQGSQYTDVAVYDTQSHATFISNVARNSLYEMQPSYSDTLISSLSIGGYSSQAKVLIASAGSTPANTTYTTRRVSGRYNGHVGTGGPNVCFQGIASDNNNCAPVNTQDNTHNEASYPGGPVWTSLALDCAAGPNATSADGDSGGPVYVVQADLSAKAAGILSTGGLYNFCYSQINFVVFLSGQEVATS